MVYHYRKNKVERVDGGSIQHSAGYHIENHGVFDLNPHGRVGNEEHVYEIAGNTEAAEAILDSIESKVRDPEDPRRLRFGYIYVRGMENV